MPPPLKLTDIPIVVISLDRRKDRYDAFMVTATAAGLTNVAKIQRLPAVDAKEFSMPAHEHPAVSVLTAHNIKHQSRRSNYEIDKAGAVGCSLSHFKAWETLLALPPTVQAIIVFEDDAVIPPDFLVRMNTMLAELPPMNEWDIITFYNSQFSGGDRGCTKQFGDTRWYSCASLIGTQAYMVNRAGARKLLDRAFPIELHMDAYMAFMTRLGFVTMIWHPLVNVEQPFNDSDIQHSGGSILNIPTKMEDFNMIVLDLKTVAGLIVMSGVAGGLLALWLHRVRTHRG
jgi:GR25 family glycosyltransferase involved in LPS biosynthesis